MEYVGLPMKDQWYLTGHDNCREAILDSLRNKADSNSRVLEKLYDIHLRSINWKWPWNSRQRRRERMLQAACDKLYYEAQELHEVAIEVIWTSHDVIDTYLKSLKETPA